MQLAGDHRVDGLQQGGFTDLVVAHHQVHVGIEGQVQMAKRLEVVDDDTFDRHAQSFDGQRARWRSLPAPWLASFPLWAILPSDRRPWAVSYCLGRREGSESALRGIIQYYPV